MYLSLDILSVSSPRLWEHHGPYWGGRHQKKQQQHLVEWKLGSWILGPPGGHKRPCVPVGEWWTRAVPGIIVAGPVVPREGHCEQGLLGRDRHFWKQAP